MSQLCYSADSHLQYEIRVRGHLASHWSYWFEGFAIALKDNGETLLSGPVVDQADLYGVLIKVRDLGLPLISVMPDQVVAAQTENSNTRRMNNDYTEHECAETDVDNIHES